MHNYYNYDFKNILKLQEAINGIFNISTESTKYYFKIPERRKPLDINVCTNKQND